MDLLGHSKTVLRWLGATGLSAALTAALVKLGASSTEAGILFLVLVVWSATLADVWLSLYVAILCALCFDFFFLPPFYSFQLAGPQAYVAMAAFFASCLVVSRVAERARRQTRQAEQRREDVERLYELSQEMMLHDDAARLVHDLPGLVRRIFALESVVLYVHDEGKFYGSTSNLPAEVQSSLRSASLVQGSPAALSSGFYTTPLTLGMKSVGALAWNPSLLSREVATAVSAQVAIALARSLAIEATARMEAAREGERLRTALIDSLTHELRTPLTSIIAAATTLLEGAVLDEAGRLDLISIVDEEASRLDQLIGEAVEMAEIDAHVVQVHMAPNHPRALLEHAVEESRKSLAAHRVEIEMEGDQGPAWFDPHLLARVLRHLLENAGRHTPAGSQIRLKSRLTPSRLEFSVEDDGPGIDSVDLPLIFEKFYRGKRGEYKGNKGSGMGLAISRAILAAHGGGIDVASSPGKGTAFLFWVPLVDKEQSEPIVLDPQGVQVQLPEKAADPKRDQGHVNAPKGKVKDRDESQLEDKALYNDTVP